jgi:hypothetical protein
LELALGHISSSSTCIPNSPSLWPHTPVAAAYKSLPPNPHGEKLFLHLTVQDANLLLPQDLKSVLIEVILTTGENISSKSIPFFCANPFTTSLALYRFSPPSSYFKL